MLKHLIILIILIILIPYAQASYFKKSNLQVAAGAQFNSLLYKRGIITYQGHQAIPIYAISLFNPNLLLAGSALYFKHNLTNNLNIRTRLHFDSSQDRPLYYTSERMDSRIRREITNELDFFLEYNFDQGHYLRYELSKDIKTHHGVYHEIRGRLALADFFKGTNQHPLIQPGFFTAIGHANKEHNLYFYGPGAKSGLNNIEYGLYITSPKVIDVFWPTLKLTRFEILGEENRRAGHVQQKAGYSLQVLMAFRVW